MDIAILGAGTVGQSLGRGLIRAGHRVMFSSRNPQSEKMQTLIAELGDSAQAATVLETLAFSNVVAVAMGWEAALEVAGQGDWSGKILLDMTQGDSRELATASGAKVVKIFNSIGAEHYQNPTFNGEAAAMLYCGDDAEAKGVAALLAGELGFETVDAGNLEANQHLVNLAKLWVHLAFRAGLGRDFAFRIVTK